MDFRDGTTQWGASFADSYDPSRDVTYHEDVSLKDFFSRPIKVASYNWSTSDVTPFFQTIDPWTLYFTNSRVANRISNYQNVSANLHVKFLINGNSFYYGRVMAEYFPLRNYDTCSDTTGLSLTPLVQASQRLHAYIDPCESQGCELYLPFIWFYDKMNMVAGDYTNMGKVYLRGMNALKHANGATGTLTISMFVWASNVKMSIPTALDISGIVPQAGKLDEYGGGIVSGVSSAVANATGKLSKIPYIGKYARATSMVASTLGDVAKMFGYSRPSIVDDVVDMRPRFVGRMAVTTGGENIAKLSVDPKQEVSIDPSIVGLGGMDEMTIKGIATRETYIDLVNWTVAGTPGSVLMSTYVNPLWRGQSTSTVYLSAAAFAMVPFLYWRGSMKFRFQIVASGYHKGRLLVVWDPYAGAAVPETNVQYSKIIDLSTDRDVTFEVGWGQEKTWLTTPSITTLGGFATPGSVLTSKSATANGVLTMYVLNELTSSNSTVNNDIQINVFQSACEDFEVAVPNTEQLRSLCVAPSTQAGTFEEVTVDDKNAPHMESSMGTFSMCNEPADDSAAVYFGERITSFRQLIKRYDAGPSINFLANATNVASNLVTFFDFPQARGNAANGSVVNNAANKRVNYQNTSVLHYIATAYLAFRGGIRRKYVLSIPGVSAPNVSMYVYRSNVTNTTQGLIASALDPTTPSNFSSNKLNTFRNVYHGMELTAAGRQPVIEVELPYYRNYRFSSPREMETVDQFNVCSLQHQIRVELPINTSGYLDSYYACAEDATFMGFQGCPPLSNFTPAV